MARVMMCDAEDGEQAAYLITDLSNGDVTAWCMAHWVDQCAAVTRAMEAQIAASAPAPVEPQPIDPVAPDTEIDPVDPVEGAGRDGIRAADVAGEELAATYDVAEVSTVDRDGPGVVWPHHPDDDVAAQRQRVHAELADRPDSARTSERDVPWPGGDGDA